MILGAMVSAPVQQAMILGAMVSAPVQQPRS